MSQVRNNRSVNYEKFVTYATGKGVTDKTIVKTDTSPTDSLGKDLTLTDSPEDGVWKFWRGQRLRNCNDTVRKFFKEAVLERLGLDPADQEWKKKLPPDVKEAMNLGDFKENEGKPLTVRRIRAIDKAITKYLNDAQPLSECQERINAICDDNKDKQYSAEVEKAFNEYASDKKKYMGEYSLNGKSIRFSGGVNRTYDFDAWIKDAFGGPRVKHSSEINMRKALAAFCNKDVFMFGVGKPTRGLDNGFYPDCKPSDISNKVNIVKSKAGGFDIFVEQKFANIGMMHNPENNERKYFNPKKPASCTVSYSYHLEAGNPRAVVSYRTMPTMKFKNYKPISVDNLRAKTKKELTAVFDEVKKKAGQMKAYRAPVAKNALRDGDKKKDAENFIDSFISQKLIGKSFAYTFDDVVEAYGNYCKTGRL